jgi:transposase
MAYGPALKQRVLALYDRGFKTKEVAERLLISRSGARRVKQRRDEPPRKVGGGHFKLDEAACGTLKGWVERTPDATLDELRTRLRGELQMTVSIGALWNTLRRLKLSLKKSRSTRASRNVRTSKPHARATSTSSKTSR